MPRVLSGGLSRNAALGVNPVAGCCTGYYFADLRRCSIHLCSAREQSVFMMAGSHVVVGIAAWVAAAPHLGLPALDGVPLAMAIGGSLLPDIDHPHSWVGRRLRRDIAAPCGHHRPSRLYPFHPGCDRLWALAALARSGPRHRRSAHRGVSVASCGRLPHFERTAVGMAVAASLRDPAVQDRLSGRIADCGGVRCLGRCDCHGHATTGNALKTMRGLVPNRISNPAHCRVITPRSPCAIVFPILAHDRPRTEPR